MEVDDGDRLQVVAGLDDEDVADDLRGRSLRVRVAAAARRADDDREEIGVRVGDALGLAATDGGKDDDGLRRPPSSAPRLPSFTASAAAEEVTPSRATFALSGADTPMMPTSMPPTFFFVHLAFVTTGASRLAATSGAAASSVSFFNVSGPPAQSLRPGANAARPSAFSDAAIVSAFVISCARRSAASSMSMKKSGPAESTTEALAFSFSAATSAPKWSMPPS